MTDDDPEAARLLEPLRHYRPPAAAPSRIDVRRAMRTGRRTVLVRQVAGTAACLVAVLGIAFSLTFSTIRTPADAGGFDVTVQEFRVGPAAGFTPLTYETGRDRQRAVLTAPGLEDTGAVVTVFAPGELPRVNGDPWEPAGESAHSIGGREAHWLDHPVVEPDAEVELAWQWTPDAWGFVSLTGLDTERYQAVEIAETVEPEPGPHLDQAASLPEGAVEGAELTGLRFSIGDAGRAELVNEARYVVDGDPESWITVGVRRPEDEDEFEYSTEIGSRTAGISEDEVVFRDGTGLYVQVGAELEGSLLDLAAAVVLDPDFDWSSAPPLSSATASPSSSGSSSSTGDEQTSPGSSSETDTESRSDSPS